MENKINKPMLGIIITFLAFMVMYAVGLAYMLIAYPMVEAKIDFWIEWIIRYAVVFGIGLPVFLLVTRNVPSEKMFNRNNVSIGHFLQYLIISLGLATAGGMIGNLLISTIIGVSINDIPNYFSGGSDIGAFLFLVFIPPIIEELFFRKILLGKLSAYGSGIAVIGTALAFTVYHTLLTYAQIVHIFLLGIFFAYLTLRTKNIICTMILHSMVNLWSVFNTRISPLLPEPIPLFTPIIVLPIMVCFIVILIKNRRKIVKDLKNLFRNKPVELLHQ